MEKKPIAFLSRRGNVNRLGQILRRAHSSSRLPRGRLFARWRVILGMRE
jgi:hypothetical protein